jgi:hypothetical protein
MSHRDGGSARGRLIPDQNGSSTYVTDTLLLILCNTRWFEGITGKGILFFSLRSLRWSSSENLGRSVDLYRLKDRLIARDIFVLMFYRSKRLVANVRAGRSSCDLIERELSWIDALFAIAQLDLH